MKPLLELERLYHRFDSYSEIHAGFIENIIVVLKIGEEVQVQVVDLDDNHRVKQVFHSDFGRRRTSVTETETFQVTRQIRLCSFGSHDAYLDQRKLHF